MAGKVSIQITGVPQLMKAIDHLTKSEWTLLVKRSVNAAMKPVKKAAAKNARGMARDTGLLAKSMTVVNARLQKRTNIISGKVQPKSEWHSGSPSKLGKKGGARFATRAASRKTRSENPAKYAHFTESGTSRGVHPMRWLRQASVQAAQPATTAFVAKARQLLPKAVKSARKKAGFSRL